MPSKFKINAAHGQLHLTAEVWREHPLFVARCKELKVVSQGKSPAQALQNLEEAISLYLEDEELEKLVVPLKFEFDFGKTGVPR
ncbi:MAG: type II toxin-antitoxin system HicB family antitoxin [Candidatus Margulisiibacteriota bacterium]